MKRLLFIPVLLVTLTLTACTKTVVCPCPLTSDQVIPCSDGSEATLWNGTDFSPCECMDAQHYQSNELPDLDCLPQGDVITAIDITPDGVTVTPDGRLDFRLPTGHGYVDGYKLGVWQHTTGTCHPDTNQTNWIVEPGDATVIIGPPDIARGDVVRHTSIFALIEMTAEVNLLGILVEPFTLENGDIVAAIEIQVSTSHRELAGQVVRVRLVGVEGDLAQIMDTLAKIPVGARLALELGQNNQVSIWWEGLIVQFYAQEIAFE